MLISLNWLREFVELPEKLDPNELGQLITKKTAEIEGFHDQKSQYAHMVVGQIKSIKPHPDADKLQIAEVDIGDKIVQLVCGGTNLYEGMFCAVTLPGALVKWHGEGELIEIKSAKVRGIESHGMIAAGCEIGLPDATDGGERPVVDFGSQGLIAGTPLAQFLEKNDLIFEFDNKSLTHRPDLWGHYGIARELSAVTGSKLKPYETTVNIPQAGEIVDVKVETPELCPRYCALKITNVKIEKSPKWLTDRLNAVGHSSHNNIVDITNYVMAELGQPLHAFDARQINDKIIVRRAKNQEKFLDLKGGEHQLDEGDLLIADTQGNLALAGVIGGENSKILDDTTEIILESANFHPAAVRRTSVKIGVRTDSVQRFEKSLDPQLAEIAIKRAAELILQLCPQAQIAGPLTDIRNFDDTPHIIELSAPLTASKIGVDLDEKTITNLLESLFFTVSPSADGILSVTVPSYRATKDIRSADDLIEEVARIYGYDNIPAILPTLPAKLPQENPARRADHKLRNLLSFGFGLSEVYNYSFYGEKELSDCLIPEAGHLQLDNYLSADQSHMRTTLVPNLLKNIRENLKYQTAISIYELGHVYVETEAYFPLEESFLAVALASKQKGDAHFFELKGQLEAILSSFAVTNLKAAKGSNAPYAHPTKSLTYLNHEGETIARIFALHPRVAKNHDLDKHQVAILELNFSALLLQPQKEQKYRQINRFPSINIDVSVVIDAEKPVGEIAEAIQNADKDLIQNVELFDLYQGDKIAATEKAVAYSITLQAPDRTLTDEDMTATQNKIIQNLEKIGGTVRR